MSSVRPRLLVLSGPSGVGKSTIVRRLLDRHGRRIEKSISATTRRPREGEKDGIDYRFLSPEEFVARRDRGEFLEWAEVHGHLYGTTRAAVDQILSQGRTCLLEIDVKGAASVRASGIPTISVFIMPPSEKLLEERLRARHTEPEDVLRRRLTVAREEMQQADRYDHVILNDSLDAACERLEEWLLASGVLPDRDRSERRRGA